MNSYKGLKIPELRKHLKRILKETSDENELRKMALDLLKKGDFGNNFIGGHILDRNPHLIPRKELEQIIYKMADSSLWDVRETAAGMLRNLLLKDFDLWFGVMKKMAKDKNVNIRRAAVVGSMAIGITENQMKKIADEIYPHVLTNSQEYIRKNLGPFAIGSFFARLFPRLAFTYLDKWMKQKDPYVRWNVLMTFSQARAKEYPHVAKKYIRLVSNDTHPVVQRAIKS
ncbi:DNA alkylation repair protein, partial [Candidatus Roizmanbacteria bacterium]|nr:DNA alkylation repair protein [Candidatus Roizmanbacteria bacterium]